LYCGYENLDFFGPNGTRFAFFHFRAQKSLDFQDPPFPMALEMDFPASKSLRPAPYKQHAGTLRVSTSLTTSHREDASVLEFLGCRTGPPGYID
jgi:hypothetical protein